MKKKRNGFTLIELLAVIVILAIIALIAVPVIMNIISKANKSAFKDSAYGIIKAGELYYSEKLLEVDGVSSTKVFEFPEADGLDLKGSRPTSGTMKVSKEGKVAIAISNGKYCIKKGYNDADIVINENIEDCVLPKEELENQNPNISSSNNCIKYDEACANGTKVNVKVNDTTNYDFYVIKDDGINLTLIMDRNLGGKVAWHKTAQNNSKGPLTSLEALKERTQGWTNIESYSYTLTDDKPDPWGSTVKYQPIEIKEVKARLLTNIEAANLGCTLGNNSCPTYLYENLSDSNTDTSPYGYWLSTAHSSFSNDGLFVSSEGHTNNSYVDNESYSGVRPVIKISKTI